MEKRFEDVVDFVYLPEPGQNLTILLVSLDGQESFLLDVRRGRRQHDDPPYDRWRLQLRYGLEVLIRLETGGPPHLNSHSAPSRRLSRYAGQWVDTPHIQRYVEGEKFPWAFPQPDEFTALDDIVVIWREFVGYCSIIETPILMGDF